MTDISVKRGVPMGRVAAAIRRGARPRLRSRSVVRAVVGQRYAEPAGVLCTVAIGPALSVHDPDVA